MEAEHVIPLKQPLQMDEQLVLQSFMDNTADAIDVLDLNYKLLMVNPAFESIYGYSASEIIGKELKIVPEHLQGELLQIRETLARGEQIKGLETVRLRKDGSLIDVSITISPIKDSHGQILAFSGISRDITEKKRTEELLHISDKLQVIGQIAAGLAHEIKNPLTALKGFLQIIQSSPDKNETYFQIMFSELERINQIVSELLVMAKPNSVEYCHVSMRAILQDVMFLLESQAAARNIGFNASFDPSDPTVYCSENQLKQVFINLIKNAIEAMPEGGGIGLTITMTPDEITVLVTDQGVGIPDHVMDKLGQPFYTTKDTGHGLGLTVCFQIIEVHGGKLCFHSEAAQGTKVTVTLPRMKTK